MSTSINSGAHAAPRKPRTYILSAEIRAERAKAKILKAQEELAEANACLECLEASRERVERGKRYDAKLKASNEKKDASVTGPETAVQVQKSADVTIPVSMDAVVQKAAGNSAFFECLDSFLSPSGVSETLKAIQELVTSVVTVYPELSKTALEVSRVGIFVAQLNDCYGAFKVQQPILVKA